MLRMRRSHGIHLALAVTFALAATSCSEGDEPKASSTDGKSRNGESSAASSQHGQDSGASAGAAAAAGGNSGATAGGGSGGTAGAAPTSDAGAAPGTFSAIYEDIFAKYCRLCHIGGTLQPDLSSRDAAFRSLVNMPANPNGQCSKLGLNRVEPGDPTKSLLFLKLSTKGAPCGQQMPPGGELKPELRSELEQWISAGAHDD